jgi:hypothetical protein
MSSRCCPRRRATRDGGELDIILDFEYDGDSLPTALTEALRDTAHEIMALFTSDGIRVPDFRWGTTTAFGQ